MEATTGHHLMMIRTAHGTAVTSPVRVLVPSAHGLTMAPPSTVTDPSADPDEALLQAYVRCGDGRALEELLQRHLADCWRLALHASGHAAEAEETLQRSWIGIMQQAPRWRRLPQGSVRGWMLGIVWNCERMRAREARRRTRWEQAAARSTNNVSSVRSAAPPARDPTPDDLAAALADLPERYRQAVTLRFLEGLAFPDIAQVLGIPQRTARTRVARGLQRLRQRLHAHGDTTIMERGLLAVAASTAQAAIPPAVRVQLGATLRAGPPSAALGASPVAAGVVAALLLGMVAVALLLADHAGNASDPAATPPGPDVRARPVLDACEDGDDGSLGRALLTTPVTCRLYHVADLQALPALLPRGMILPLAWPVPSGDYLPWAGTTLIGQDTPLHRLIDQACHDLGLRWQVHGHYVVVSLAPTPSSAALIDAAATPPPRPLPGNAAQTAWRAGLTAQSRQLALCRTLPALRLLLLRLGADDPVVALAARDALVRMVGTPWSTRRSGMAYTGLLADRALAAQVARADRTTRSGTGPGWLHDPYLVYLHGLFPAPGDDRHLEALLGQLAADAPQWPRLSAVGRHHQQSLACAAALACAQLSSPVPSVASAPLRAALVAAARGALDDPSQPPALRTVMALARIRCGDAGVLPDLMALWRDPRASAVDLDTDADGSAHALVDATTSAVEQVPHDRRLLLLLVDIAVTDAERTRRGAAAAALVALRDPRCLAPLISACTRNPGHVAEAMSVVIGTRLPEAVPALRILAGSAPTPDLAVQADGAALACADAQAVDRLIRDVADPQRRKAAVLLLGNPEHPQALQALLGEEAAHPDDAMVLQALAWSRHPLAIQRLVERLAALRATDGITAPFLIALLGASHDPVAAQSLVALIARGGAPRPLALAALQQSQWPGILLLTAPSAPSSSGARMPRSDQLADPLVVWRALKLLPPGSPDGAVALGATDNAFLDMPWRDARAFEASLPDLVVHDARPPVRMQALVALTDLNDPLQRPDVVDCYQQALTDPDRRVRGTARAAVANARDYLLDGTQLQLGHLGVVADASAVAVLAHHLAPPAPTATPPPAPGF